MEPGTDGAPGDDVLQRISPGVLFGSFPLLVFAVLYRTVG